MVIRPFQWNRRAICLEIAFTSFFVLFFLVNEGFAQNANTFSNNTSNATGEATSNANTILNMASGSGLNATQTAMNQAKDIMTNPTNNVSSIASNATGASLTEANEIISAASNSLKNVTNVTSSSVQTQTGLKNYTSSLYQIQFRYPGNWELIEKKTRFDEGSDISVSSFSPSGYISVQYLNSSVLRGSDMQSLLYEFFKSSIDGDYSREYKIIEQPSFTNINDQKAGTYLYTDKDKYEEFATRWATQNWVVRVGDHGYLISFMTSTDLFDSPEMKNIRDQFIKSIKFSGVTNQTNVPNRFD